MSSPEEDVLFPLMGALSGQPPPGNGGVLPPPAGAGGTSGVGVGAGVGRSRGGVSVLGGAAVLGAQPLPPIPLSRFASRESSSAGRAHRPFPAVLASSCAAR